MKDTNRKVALFISSGTEDKDMEMIVAGARPLEEWAEGANGYTRISEYVELDFGLRDPNEYIPDQIADLEGKKEELRAELEKDIAKIDALIGTLAAIEYKPDVDV